MNYNIDEYYASRYLSGEKLQEKLRELGKPSIKATIERVGEEEMYNNRKKKMEKDLVVFFKGFDKGLRLKAERGRALRDLFGKMTDNWVGKEITLITKPRNVGGQTKQMIWFAEAGSTPQVYNTKNDDLPSYDIEEDIDINDIPL